MSIGTGIAVFAATDSGTLRARDMTADCSAAFAKIGPVMVGGSRTELVFASADGLIAMGVVLYV
jgi:hypothetical protein